MRVTEIYPTINAVEHSINATIGIPGAAAFTPTTCGTGGQASGQATSLCLLVAP